MAMNYYSCIIKHEQTKITLCKQNMNRLHKGMTSYLLMPSYKAPCLTSISSSDSLCLFLIMKYVPTIGKAIAMMIRNRKRVNANH